jgi:hypothetical protein
MKQPFCHIYLVIRFLPHFFDSYKYEQYEGKEIFIELVRTCAAVMAVA